MKVFHICSVIILTSILAVASAEDLESAWKEFVVKFGNTIDLTKDALAKKSRFAEAHQIMEKHNRDPNATYFMRLTQFSVMTELERKGYLMDVKLFNLTTLKESSSALQNSSEQFGRAIPASIDYRTSACLGRVKDQKQCGSCWAFAAVASLEYYNCIQNGYRYVSLSEQQLVDCDSSNKGCSGGSSDDAWNYFITVGGAETAASYPYTGRKGSCRFNPSKVGAKVVASFGYTGNNVASIQQALVSYGPVVIYFHATELFMKNYGGGVYSATDCNDEPPNHVMNIVGYGTDAATGMGYWIVRNSWGPGWGLSGYALIQRGVNMCSIESYPVYLKPWELASSPASASGGVVRFGYNCTLFTDDAYSGTFSSDEEDCWTSCLNSDSCTHFRWNKKQLCYLKPPITGRAKNGRAVGGICGFVACRSKQLEPTSTAQSRSWNKYKGGLIRFDSRCSFNGLGRSIYQANIARKEDCFDLCLRYAECSHFTHRDSNCILEYIRNGATATSYWLRFWTTCGFVAGRSNQPIP